MNFFYTQKKRWKFILFGGAILIGFLSLAYTKNLTDELKEEELKKVKLWAEATRELSVDSPDASSINLIFEVIKNNTTVPVILTDLSDTILYHRNFKISGDNVNEELQEELLEMKANNDSIEIDLGSGDKQVLYYKDSTMLRKLTWFPVVQLIVVSIFMLVAYLAISGSRRAEQNQVWVGMAKETAHQLGTPTSSLLGWIDLLKMKNAEPMLVEELQKDVDRLQTITDRFSKIGSAPELKEEPLIQVIGKIINYLKVRASSQVEITMSAESQLNVVAKINSVLFEWVIENLCKNAMDAMEGKGRIVISIRQDSDKLFIDISDTGKGIAKSKLKTVFEPGFTTKKRGWGLGLSLSKRIIEEYHNGKIFVKDSEPGVGTTFRVVLRGFLAG